MQRRATNPGVVGPLKPAVVLWALMLFGLALSVQVAVKSFLADGRAEVTQRERVVEQH